MRLRSYPGLLLFAIILVYSFWRTENTGDQSGSLSTPPASTQWTFRPAYNLDYDGNQGRADISVVNQKISEHELVSVNIRFSNLGTAGSFYNASFKSPGPVPAALAVWDSERHYVADLLDRRFDSQETVTSRAWTGLANGGTLATQIRRPAQIPLNYILKPGRYILQLIYYRAFVGRDDVDSIEDFYRKFDRAELFRSNSVDFEIVPSEPESNEFND